MRAMRIRSLVAVLVFVTACSATSAQPAKQPLPSDVVAKVGSTSITLAEVDDKALQQPTSAFASMKLSLAIYEARRATIEDLVANALVDQEAKARGVDRAALVEQEIAAKAPNVTDNEIVEWYRANQNRVQGRSIEEVRQPIRAYLTQERMQLARQQFIDALRLKTPVRVMLEAPRQNVAAAKGAAKGPANAPIEIIE